MPRVVMSKDIATTVAEYRRMTLRDIVDVYVMLDAVERGRRARESHEHQRRVTEAVHRRLTGGR